ncbi:MAG: alanine racemase, partial [Clostridia bacterium]
AMVDGGVSDVYVANQVVAAHAIERLVTLSRRARVAVAVDQAANVRDLSAAATAHQVTLYVRIEVDAGMGRAGVHPGQDALELAQVVHRSPGLEFEGLHAYEGHVVSAADRAYRELHTRQMLALIMDTRDRIAASGIPCPVVTCGGTGTYDISGVYPGVTEHQAGSYVYMDPGYHRTVPAFGLALTVLATVTSRPTAERVITDAGLQTLGGDAGPGEPKGMPDLVPEELSEEHGTLRLASQSPMGLCVGDRLELYPGHCDSVVNLHDRVYAVRDGRVEAVWRVTARGCSQ